MTTSEQPVLDMIEVLPTMEEQDPAASQEQTWSWPDLSLSAASKSDTQLPAINVSLASISDAGGRNADAAGGTSLQRLETNASPAQLLDLDGPEFEMHDSPLPSPVPQGERSPAGSGATFYKLLALLYFIPVVSVLVSLQLFGRVASLSNSTCVNNITDESLWTSAVSGTFCSPFITSSSTTSYYVFGKGIGCAYSLQACNVPQSTIREGTDLYSSSFFFDRCWNVQNSSLPFYERVWASLPLSEVSNPGLNVSAAVSCCRTLPGDVFPASVTSILLRGATSLAFDVILNLISSIPFVAKLIDYLHSVVKRVFVQRREDDALCADSSLSTASVAVPLIPASGSAPAEDDVVFFWCDTVFLPSSVMSAKVIGLSLFAVVSAILSLRSTAQDFTVWQLYNHWAAIIVNGPVFEGWLDIGQMYFVWFCCKTDFLRAPLLKSAHCCIIGMSEFVIQQFKMVVPSAAVAAKQRGDPAAQFFLLCIPARVGSNFTWLIYVVPYVTHICPASFFYLPAGFMFFLVVTLATGLVIAGFIAPVFDTYGDSWRAEATARNSDSPLSAILVAKQVRTFVGRFVMGGCYAIAATFTYTLLCNWAVLLYENGYYRNSEGYISVVWDELSMRNAPCSLLSFREAIHRGDALRIVEGVISYF